MRLKTELEVIFNKKLNRALTHYNDLISKGIRPDSRQIIKDFCLSRNDKLITIKSLYKILKRRNIFTYRQYIKKRNLLIFSSINSGDDTGALEKKFNMTHDQIIAVYNKYNPISGGEIQRSGVLEEMVQQYINGTTQTELASSFGFSIDQVKRALIFEGVEIRERYEIGFKHTNIDNNYFSVIDSKLKAWILGFIFADGSISSNELCITQDREHDYILKRIAEEIGHNGNFTTAAKSHTARLQSILTISRHIIVEDLKKTGLTNNKENDLSFPFATLKKDYWLAFIAGFFVGDGCIHIPKKMSNFNPVTSSFPKVEFTSTQKMCLDIQRILESIIPNVTLHVRKESRKNAYYLSTYKQNDTILILNALSRESLGLFQTKKFFRASQSAEVVRYRNSIRYLRSNNLDRANLLPEVLSNITSLNNSSKRAVEDLLGYSRIQDLISRNSFVTSPELNLLCEKFSLTYYDVINFKSLEQRNIIPGNIWRRKGVTLISMPPYVEASGDCDGLFYT